jgi:hypothetical protein
MNGANIDGKNNSRHSPHDWTDSFEPNNIPKSGKNGRGQKSNRRDWTRLEPFLASVRRWETGLWRIFVWETDGKRP